MQSTTDPNAISNGSSNGTTDHFFVNPVFKSDEIVSNSNEIVENELPSSKVNQTADSDFIPTTISWINLNVYSKGSSGLAKCFSQPKEPVHIIKNVSGLVKPGNLLAILGSSGAGKTTLLNVLTGQNLNNVTIDGQVMLNNSPTTIQKLSLCSSYVQQDDIFFGQLTVKEHLIFQLKLRTAVPLTNKQVNSKIDQLLIKLGLSKVSDNRINCESTGQRISGGERKRLSVATEILKNPSILFCDEPTSGLDSFMAQSVVTVLKSLACEQRTVICTIHQPSSEIFKMFDNIMLLAQGRLVFLGTTTKALEFFSQNGLACPSNYNPPDYFIQQLSIIPGSEEKCESKVKMICDNFESSVYYQDFQCQLTDESNALYKDDEKFTSNSQFSMKTQRNIVTQFILLVWRSTLINLRDPMLTASRVANSLFSVLLLLMVYWRQDYNQEGIMNINGAIFLLIVNANFSSIFVVINAFCMETPIFLREQTNGLYRVSIYLIAKMFSDLPYFLILPVLTWSASYYAIDLYNEPGAFLMGNVVCILVTNAASGFGYFISSISTSMTVGSELATAFLAPLVLLGGTFLNPSTIASWLTWLKYFSWIFYANEILTINQWQHVSSIECDYDVLSIDSKLSVDTLMTNGTIPSAGQGCLINGNQVISSVGFKKSNLKIDYWMLVLVILMFRILAYVSLRVRVKLRR